MEAWQRLLTLIIGSLACSSPAWAQMQGRLLPHMTLRASLATELSWGEEQSHYFYNEIHASHRDWRLGIREINLVGAWHGNHGLSVQSRVQLRRETGQKLREFRLLQAQLHLERPRWSWSLGQIMSPFGSFYQRPLPEDRQLITNPLPYSYYVNISDLVGYSSALQEPQELRLNGHRIWGRPLLYPDGYRLGIKGHWDIQPDTLGLDVALVQASPITPVTLSNPIHPTLVARLQWQPAFHYRQGISLSYGGYMQRNAQNAILEELGSYRQLLLGLDFRLGTGYLEWSGEVIGAWQQAPVYDAAQDSFSTQGEQAPWLQSISGYLDFRAEIPGWVGGYVVYRIGWISFGPGAGLSRWDDRTMRHSLGVGYQVNAFLLLKTVFAWQTVQNKDWPLDQWRSSLVIFL